MQETSQGRKALVLMLLDVLATFPPALSRLPADPPVHKAQRAVTVLENALKEVLEKI